MKKLLLVTIAMASGMIMFGQQLAMSGREPKMEGTVAVTSPHKDTLYLPDDTLGASIRWIWMNKPLKNQKTPVLITCSEEELMHKFLLYYAKNYAIKPK